MSKPSEQGAPRGYEYMRRPTSARRVDIPLRGGPIGDLAQGTRGRLTAAVAALFVTGLAMIHIPPEPSQARETAPAPASKPRKETKPNTSPTDQKDTAPQPEPRVPRSRPLPDLLNDFPAEPDPQETASV